MHSKINERLVDNEDFLETAVVEEFLRKLPISPYTFINLILL